MRRLLWCSVVCASLIVGSLALGPTVVGQDVADRRLSTVRKGLEYRNSSLSRGEGLAMMEVVSWGSRDAAASPAVVCQYVYKWRYDGERFFQERLRRAGPGLRQESMDVKAWDGTHGESLASNKCWVDAPPEHVGGVGITDLLDIHNAHYPTIVDELDRQARIIGSESVDGFETLHIGKKTREIDHEWWIVPALDFLPLVERRESLEAEVGPRYQERATLPLLKETAEKHKVTSPVVVPFVSELRAFDRDGGRRVLRVIWRVTLYNSAFGQPPTIRPYVIDVPLGVAVAGGARDEERYGLRPDLSAAKSEEALASVIAAAQEGALPIDISGAP